MDHDGSAELGASTDIAVELHRLGTPTRSPLRAWSSADELGLRVVAATRGSDPGLPPVFDSLVERLERAARDSVAAEQTPTLLIVNDTWGALTVALRHWNPTTWVDSALSRAAIAHNLSLNGLLRSPAVIGGDMVPRGRFELALVVIPKSRALADFQLNVLTRLLAPGAVVLGLTMARHLTKRTVNLFDRVIGSALVSPTWRKAKLVYSQMPGARDTRVRVQPSGHLESPGQAPGLAQSGASDSSKASEPGGIDFVTDEGVKVMSGPGVFSSGRLDRGTALLLRTLRLVDDELGLGQPDSSDHMVVVDLACGSGVVGATIGLCYDPRQVVLTDVSDIAIATARRTWAANDLCEMKARFVCCDALEPLNDRSVNLIVSNPPFHIGHSVDRALTDRLIGDASRVLARSGSLLVVGERNQGLHFRLRKWFARVKVCSSDPSFVVLLATDPV